MNFESIMLWVFLLLWCVVFLHETKVQSATGVSARSITTDAIFIAIIMVMGLVPNAGYLTIVPGVSLTIMHLPVLLGAYLFGWKKGLLYGVAFGLTSWIQAISNAAGLNAFFIYPWISVLPRALFGLLSGLFFQLLGKNPKIYKNPVIVGLLSLALTVLHTALVFGALFIFFFGDISAYFSSPNSVVEGAFITFIVLILIGVAGESALAAIMTPVVSKALERFARKQDN